MKAFSPTTGSGAGHRFFLPPAECEGPVLTLAGPEAHHALRVLRVRVREAATVLDGAGGSLECEVASVSGHEVKLTVRERHHHPPPLPRLTLIQALAKPRSMDWIIQKATELGAHRVVPILAERSVPQIGREAAPAKAARWRDLAVEAVKQCGLPWLPAIEPPVRLTTFAAAAPRFDLALVASLEADAASPRLPVQRFRAAQGRSPLDLAVWVGPEGDFSPGELETIRALGAAPITLGPRVLRCETAAVVALALLAYEVTSGADACASSQSQAGGST